MRVSTVATSSTTTTTASTAGTTSIATLTIIATTSVINCGLVVLSLSTSSGLGVVIMKFGIRQYDVKELPKSYTLGTMAKSLKGAFSSCRMANGILYDLVSTKSSCKLDSFGYIRYSSIFNNF
mgnify:FL=1